VISTANRRWYPALKMAAGSGCLTVSKVQDPVRTERCPLAGVVAFICYLYGKAADQAEPVAAFHGRANKVNKGKLPD
jgi:hypothetical protein